MNNYIKTLTNKELKTACKSFYRKAEKSQKPADMLVFNTTYKALKKRLNANEFKVFSINL